MSASAEVYLSVSSNGERIEDKVCEVVAEWLVGAGFPYEDSNEQHSRLRAGDIWEIRGYSVDWRVFEQEWADGLIREINEAQPSLDAEVYVYNLEREADNSSRTSRIVKEATGV